YRGLNTSLVTDDLTLTPLGLHADKLCQSGQLFISLLGCPKLLHLTGRTAIDRAIWRLFHNANARPFLNACNGKHRFETSLKMVFIRCHHFHAHSRLRAVFSRLARQHHIHHCTSCVSACSRTMSWLIHSWHASRQP